MHLTSTKSNQLTEKKPGLNQTLQKVFRKEQEIILLSKEIMTDRQTNQRTDQRNNQRATQNTD